MARSELDLQQLALDRSGAPTSRDTPRPRRWVSRYAVPAGILLGFVLLLTFATGSQFLPRTPVTVVPVITQRGATQVAGTALFQAPGWIEPCPTKVSVPALAAGVIQELLVVEGQLVTQDQPLARLITTDAEISVEQSRAALKGREGERQRAQAELTAAESRLATPLHLDSQLADAQGQLAKAQTELGSLPFFIRTAEANLAFQRKSLQGKHGAEGAVAGIIVLQAERDLAVAQAELEELQTRGANLEHEISALQQKVEVLSLQRKLLIEEQRQVAEARAKVVAATAACDEARVNLELAELDLERTTVRAPMAGRILRLVAAPGLRVMGLQQSADGHGSTVVEMYDPERLQVRVDVRLEDVPQVIPGGMVEIQTASSPSLLQGRVLQPTSTANIQKNTLEVKVELLDPPPTIRPEMLATATFLAPSLENGEVARDQAEQICIPQELLINTPGGSFVWIVDGNQKALRQPVEPGPAVAGGLVEIRSGLNSTDKLIASETSDLQNGTRLTIRGEDRTLGVER